jgi:hypothetical protein
MIESAATNDHAATFAATRQTLKERIERAEALKQTTLRGYVVVSSLWIGRGVYIAPDGREALGPFAGGEPHVFSFERSAYAALLRWRSHLTSKLASEGVSMMTLEAWWAEAERQARSTLDFLAEAEAAHAKREQAAA